MKDFNSHTHCLGFSTQSGRTEEVGSQTKPHLSQHPAVVCRSNTLGLRRPSQMSRRVEETSSGVLHWPVFKNMTHFNFNAYILWLLKTLDLSCKQFDLNNTVCRRPDQRSSPVGVLPEEEEESVVLELLHKDEHNFPSLGTSPQTVQPLQTHLPSIVCDES